MPRHPPFRPPQKPKKLPKNIENLIRENTGDGAALRLMTYVGTYQEYMDRDRDIILLSIYSMLKKLRDEPSPV